MNDGYFHGVWGPDLGMKPETGRPSTARLAQAAAHHGAAERESQADTSQRVNGDSHEHHLASHRSVSCPSLVPKKSPPPSPTKPRETVSQRMKRVLAERKQAGPQPQPELQHQQHQPKQDEEDSESSKKAASKSPIVREARSLEDLCILQLADNAKNNRLPVGILSEKYCPDYLRQKIFEEVRRCNQLLLSGNTLKALVCGALFTHLHLRNASNLRDSDLEAIAPSLPQICDMDISYCAYVTDVGVGAVLSGCSSLTSLTCEHLQRLTGHGSFAHHGLPHDPHACEALTGLVSLSLAGCESLVDEAVRAAWGRAQGLVAFNLASCDKLTDQAVLGLASTSLTSLVLSYTTKITDTAVSSIARGCPFLKKLQVAGCAGVTDVSLRVVAARLPSLTSIDLSFLDGVSDGGVEILASVCRELKVLGLEQCPSITDASLRSLADFCDHLTDLNVAFCHSLSEGAIIKVYNKCELASLNVTQCRNVSMPIRFWLMASSRNSAEKAKRAKEEQDAKGTTEGAATSAPTGR